jgi:hypothetical protein
MKELASRFSYRFVVLMACFALSTAAIGCGDDDEPPTDAGSDAGAGKDGGPKSGTGGKGGSGGTTKGGSGGTSGEDDSGAGTGGLDAGD